MATIGVVVVEDKDLVFLYAIDILHKAVLLPRPGGSLKTVFTILKVSVNNSSLVT